MSKRTDKPKLKGGRPSGTTKVWQENNKTLKMKGRIQAWANSLTPRTLKMMEDLAFNDKKASPVVKKGIGELILKLNDKYLEGIELGEDGQAKTVKKIKRGDTDEYLDQSGIKKHKEDVGLISLTFEGDDFSEEGVGT